jgi:hypothetical protein
VTAAARLARVLGRPALVQALEPEGWTALLTCARAERLLGTLAAVLEGQEVPPAVEAILADARDLGAAERDAALWEAEMARRALAPLGVPVLLLKGTAYAALGLAAGAGRMIGDLEFWCRGRRCRKAEAALIAAGWEWVKPGPL